MKTEQEAIIRTICAYLTWQPEIIFAYIYGSFAQKKDFHDIDIGIFVKGDALSLASDLEYTWEEELKQQLNLKVDVRIINRAPIYFLYQVIKERLIIVDKLPSLRADFESWVFKSYFDIAHFRNEYLKEIGNAPI